MSLLRAEALAALHRWRALIAAAALALGASALLGRAALAGAPLAMALLVLSLLVALWLGRDALARLRLARTGGAGVVAVAEGRIEYFGPETGGMADLDALRAVEIGAGSHWLLRTDGAPPLRIPLAAEGAAALLDAFAALPGFSAERAAAAVARPGAHVIVWRRTGTPPRLAGTLASLPLGSYISRHHNPEDGP